MLLSETLFTTILFILAVLGIFFLPGFLALRIVFRSTLFSSFETIVFSFALSLGLLDVTMLLLGRADIHFSPISIALGLSVLLILLWIFTQSMARLKKNKISDSTSLAHSEVWTLSKKGSVIFLILMTATFVVRLVYFSDAALPTATDMGHHMYWAKNIVQNKTLPVYEKIEVVVNENGKTEIAPPQPIADFIIGEHLPFAALALFTGLDFTSAAPINFLILVNLLSLIAVAALAARLVLAWPTRPSRLTPEIFFLATLLFLGPLYALASPQAKFVSGGVVGNLFGNFFIPLVLLALSRAFVEKRSEFLALGIFLSFILAYTHHLSTLVLFFVLTGFLIAQIFLGPREIQSTLYTWWKLFLSPQTWLVILSIVLFIVAIAVPSYLEREAIDSALGTPVKSTRTGLSFLQTTNTIGFGKIALGLTGIVFLLFWKKSLLISRALLLGWSGILLLMTLFPHFLLLDIPSNRIGSYLIYPFALTAGLALLAFLHWLAPHNSLSSGITFALPTRLTTFIIGLVFLVIFANGSLENTHTLPALPKVSALNQTFAVSRYLASHSTPNDIVLKDHNYITADAWMKLFFLRDYGYPLSRGFFSRYAEGGSRRERCTLDMISVPNTPQGKKCYEETGINIIVVNPEYDMVQFEKSRNFSRWYASSLIHIYAQKP